MARIRRYLLDTHVILWYLSGDERLPEDIRNSIDYYENEYWFSIESMKEIVALKKAGRIKQISALEILKALKQMHIKGALFDEGDLLILENIPLDKKHQDPIDLALISTAIELGATLVSADTKFPSYREHGLSLLEIA
ncbi:MAG: type II toxin-antitoxin system VapC family toxin [Oscillospiraceae bacterium]|nr:type II toxin-antitoxin system VapC family toxin [Oscillospiraceae bacterium]